MQKLATSEKQLIIREYFNRKASSARLNKTKFCTEYGITITQLNYWLKSTTINYLADDNRTHVFKGKEIEESNSHATEKLLLFGNDYQNVTNQELYIKFSFIKFKMFIFKTDITERYLRNLSKIISSSEFEDGGILLAVYPLISNFSNLTNLINKVPYETLLSLSLISNQGAFPNNFMYLIFDKEGRYGERITQEQFSYFKNQVAVIL